MIYYLKSTDPSDYGTIHFNSSFFNQSKHIEYRITSMSTLANFYVTTSDDYVVVNDMRLQFTDHGGYDINTFMLEINSVLSPLSCSFDSLGRVVLQHTEPFTLTDASHRAKMLLGLYDTDLPLVAQNGSIVCPSAPYLCYGNLFFLKAHHGSIVATNATKNREEYHCIVYKSSEFVYQGLPIMCYGNLFFLKAHHGSIVATNATKNREEYHCIVYKSSEFVYQGLPIICRHAGVPVTTTSDDFRTLEFTLVDCKLHEVKLLAPLHLTIEVVSNDSRFYVD